MSTIEIPSQYAVKINGETIVLDMSSLLGDGGEALVVRTRVGGKEYAAKIIRPSMRSGLRIRKLNAQLTRRPPMSCRAVAPILLVYDAQTNAVVGHCMEVINPDRYEDLVWWMKVEHRTTNNIEFNDVCWVFLELREELEALHNAGYVIGDFNPGGIKVLKKQYWDESNKMKRIKLVDSDCVEFDDFACPVFTLAYFDYKLAPQLQSIGKTGVYSKLSDYFAFDAMFFEALTLAGAYDGTHQIYDAPTMRVGRGITVLHDSVEYPNDSYVLPFESLPKPFQEYFKASFVKGERKLFPSELIQQSLGLKITRAPMQRTVATSTSKVKVYDVLIEGLGDILDYAVSGSLIVILSYLAGEVVWTKIFEGNALTRPIPDTIQGHTYRLLNTSFVMDTSTYHAAAGNGGQRIYNLEWQMRHTVMTNYALMGKPILGGGQDCVYVAAGAYLYRMALDKRKGVDAGNKTPLHMANKNTAIQHDPITGNVMGCIRTGVHYSWFFVRKDRAYDIQIAELEDTETLDDVAVEWNDSTALVVRLTTYKGAKRTRFDEVTLSSSYNGNRLLTGGHIADGELLRPLDSGVYMHSDKGAILLYATQKGIVRENITTGESQTFTQTKGLVRRGDGLVQFREGLLVIGGGRVCYISL